MLHRTRLSIPEPAAPWLARRLAPAGPPALERFDAAGAAVVCVPGRYCVSYLLLGPESLILVDVGSLADLDRLAAVVALLARPVSLVVASHLHFDHVLGLDGAARRFGARLTFGRAAEAAVAAGRPLRYPGLRNAGHFFPTWLWQGLPLFARADVADGLRFGFAHSRNPFAAPRAPALGEGDPLPDLPGWTVLETPGHADEALCLYHEAAGFLVAGDTVRNYRRGEWNPLRTDRRQYAATVARLRHLPASVVFPGHGPAIVGQGVLGRLRVL